MPPTVYVLNGSHPCAAVLRAMDLKGIAPRVVELPLTLHAPVQRVRFGRRTVPGLKLEDGEKIVGSRPIMRRLDELVPEPALLPADADARAAVLRAEEWGEEVLQPLARRVFLVGAQRRPGALHSYQEGSRLPPIPRPVLRVVGPVVIRAERALHDADEAGVRADLRSLHGHLDRVDRWIEDGLLGGPEPNAADLQIAPSLRLLMTAADVLTIVDGRPAAELALRHFPDFPGHLPEGTFPPEWLRPLGAAAR
ncbi:MAG: glutathione S-transferase family protein [Actinomycetota bacterium]|nr:glutathione S-transferase family protein [Actinomycetota bacterium]